MSARLALAVTLCAGCAAPALPPSAPTIPELASGDLLFLDLACGELCDAIESVTLEQLGVPGPRLSHVGIVEVDRDGRFLIEAWPPRVVRTPLAEALLRAPTGGRHLLRLTRAGGPVGERAVREARRRLGIPYDEDFLVENGRLYCSELVLEAYRGPGGERLFAAAPMSFGKPGSPARAAWERHYRGRGRPIPDGAPGQSPLGIYLQARRGRAAALFEEGSARW